MNWLESPNGLSVPRGTYGIFPDAHVAGKNIKFEFFDKLKFIIVSPLG